MLGSEGHETICRQMFVLTNDSYTYYIKDDDTPYVDTNKLH